MKVTTLGFMMVVAGAASGCRDSETSPGAAAKPVETAAAAASSAPGAGGNAGGAGTGGDMKGMHGGDMKGMHGGDMKGMHGGDMKGMHGGMPMMGKGMCAQMMAGATTTVENTSDGAVIRMSATDKAGVEKVQQMAAMMRDCMSPADAGTQK